MLHNIFIGLLVLAVIACIVVLLRIQPETAATERKRRKIITGKTGEMPKVVSGAMDNQEATTIIPAQTFAQRTDTVMMPAVRVNKPRK